MTPLEFLKHLWESKPEDQWVLIWSLPDKRSRWFASIPEAAEYVAGINGTRDVYVGVGLAGKDYGATHRCVSEEITGLTGMWSDLDLRSDAHGRKALPATIEQALTILPPALPPTIIICTGNGLHCWWLLKEPYIFDDEQDRRDAMRIAARWHTLLQLNAAGHGWAYERLSDLARVLRIPGTRNLKNPSEPKEIVAHSFTDRRYNLSEFEEFLDACGIPDPEAQERAAKEWAERFADKPLVIDIAARIPEETLKAWMEADMRFRNTWLRQRHDLKDQSNSGYDLALACFGVDAGLPEQQIVDLIVHHRARHGRDQRTREEYFQRTIAKAARPAGGLATPATPRSPAGAPQGAQNAPQCGQPRNEATGATDHARALLCANISAALGIPIVRLVKFTGKEPVYHMALGPECVIVEFPSVGKFISQDAVRMAVAGAVGLLIRRIKPREWEVLAQMMLNACIVEESDLQQEFVGAARGYIASYLAETGFIESIESQTVQDQKKPLILDDEIAINASDLQTYVNKTTFQNLSVKAIASMLGALGAKQRRVRGVKFREQSRWLIPVSEFDPAEYRPEYPNAGEAPNA